MTNTFVRTGLAVGLAAFAAPVSAQLAAPDCAAPPAKTPQLPATIPFDLRTNHVTFWVCHGTTPMMYVLDTGAGMSIMDLGIAKSLGARIESEFRATGAGAGSAAAGRMARDSVWIPGAVVTVPITTAIDLASVAGADASKMQGILGADFIARYVVALDYLHREMRLYDRASFKYDGPGTTVPFTLTGNNFIHVQATVNLDDGSSASGDMVVDVGSSMALALSRPFIEANHLRDRITPTVHRPGGRGVGGMSFADIGRIPSFSIGNVKIEKPIVSLYADSAGVLSSSAGGAGNIGGDILRRFTVYFDYRARHMIFEPHEKTAEPFEADMSGLAITPSRDSSGYIVDFVVAKSPAGELGMKKGDNIVAVDGRPATLGALEELRQRLRREGEHVSITVKRGMTPVVFALVTRRLV